MADLTKIPELAQIWRLDTIQNVALLANFVYTLVPNDIDTGFDLSQDVVALYNKYKNKENFGWCYSSSLYLHMLLKEYHKDSYLYNFGFTEKDTGHADRNISHAVVIVTIQDNQYLIDPYFNKYFIDRVSKQALTFDKLILFSKYYRNRIESVYGPGLKPIKRKDSFIEVEPQIFEKMIMDFFKTELDYDNVMTKNYKTTDITALLSKKISKVRVLAKMNKELYYEFW